MADGPSAEDAATDLGDGDSRQTRERHKRQDASSSMTASGTGQDIARRIHEDASVLESHPQHRQQNPHRPPRRNYHAHSHPVRRHCGAANAVNANANEGNVDNVNNGASNRQNYHDRREHEDDVDVDGKQRASKTESVEATCVVPFASSAGEEDEEEESAVDRTDPRKEKKRKDASKKCRFASVRGDETKTAKKIESGSDNSSNNDKSGREGDDVASSVGNGRRSRCATVAAVFLDPSGPNDDEDEDDGDGDDDDEDDDEDEEEHESEKAVNRFECDKSDEAGREDEDAARKTDGVASDGSSDGGTSAGRSSSSGGGGGAAAAAVSASGSGGGGGAANGLVAARHQGSPFKGQVRMAEDTLVGPCGKKRCADRYDSSESSDSGVAVSCGECCSSSGTSDITEPGSPCSTSSDEGVAIRGASASPLPSLPKLAPSSQIGARPQWPWTPPLAATACSTYKRLKGEPEAGALPRSGAADPSFRGITKSAAGKPSAGHHRHETQGKITEYFKAQIKPQQAKVKKNGETMSVLVAKSSTEFRRPATVQRNRSGLAKYLGPVSPSSRAASDWEIRSLAMSPPSTKKPPTAIVPRCGGKAEKKSCKPTVGLPVSNDATKSTPSCKISSLRLTSEASGKNASPATTAAPTRADEPTSLDFKGCIGPKPRVNENNNLTNGCGSVLGSLRSQGSQDPLSRLTVPKDAEKTEEARASPAAVDDVDEEGEDSRSSGSKPSLSPILSAPTTIRFPAREPGKDRQQGADSGVCRWDKCEESFESSGELLEHLQAAHINTQTGGDNFVCQWQGCKVQGRSSCSRRWLERHVLSHGGNKPFRCIVDNCGSRFSSQTALERHVNGHFNQPETSSNSGRRSCESGGKLVRRNGKRLRYRRQPWSARLFDYFDSGVMEGLQHRLLQLAASRTQGRLAETPGNSMSLTSQVLARRVELDGKTKVLLRWYPPDIEPDEWVLESEVRSTKNVRIRKAAASNPEQVSLALYSAMNGGAPPSTRPKQRRKCAKNS